MSEHFHPNMSGTLVPDRHALAQDMHDLYAQTGDAQLALSHFRQFRSPVDLRTLERTLDALQQQLLFLEREIREGAPA